jgi:hypothetical protein
LRPIPSLNAGELVASSEGFGLENPTLAKHGGDRKSGKRDQADNISLKPQHGTSATYLAARIKRDAPEQLTKKDCRRNLRQQSSG